MIIIANYQNDGNKFFIQFMPEQFYKTLSILNAKFLELFY